MHLAHHGPLAWTNTLQTSGQTCKQIFITKFIIQFLLAWAVAERMCEALEQRSTLIHENHKWSPKARGRLQCLPGKLCKEGDPGWKTPYGNVAAPALTLLFQSEPAHVIYIGSLISWRPSASTIWRHQNSLHTTRGWAWNAQTPISDTEWARMHLLRMCRAQANVALPTHTPRHIGGSQACMRACTGSSTPLHSR